jgi:uncharacterized protein (UPF0332 family)
LRSEDIDVIKHSAVQPAIGYYCAKPGRINPDLHRILIEAGKIRESADYGFYIDIVEPTVTAKREEAKYLLSEIKRYRDIH